MLRSNHFFVILHVANFSTSRICETLVQAILETYLTLQLRSDFHHFPKIFRYLDECRPLPMKWFTMFSTYAVFLFKSSQVSSKQPSCECETRKDECDAVARHALVQASKQPTIQYEASSVPKTDFVAACVYRFWTIERAVRRHIELIGCRKTMVMQSAA